MSKTIRASLHEVEVTLVIAVLLVIGVVGVFLESWRATVVPAVATVASLLGTLAVIYLLGFSLNNLSLMALTIATGFVVDDAIVVLENIQRHIEEGMPVRKAAFLGAGEVSFTVLSISLSLVAVFIPLLFMGGLPAPALFNEFAVTMTVAVLISMVLSLTSTPMLAAMILKAVPEAAREPQRAGRLDRAFAQVQRGYARLLDWALIHRRATVALLVAALALQFVLLAHIPKGLFPDQDTGAIMGAVRADQAMSFDDLDRRLHRISATIKADPGVENVVSFTGGQRVGGGFLFVTLKPGADRASAREIVAPAAHAAGGIHRDHHVPQPGAGPTRGRAPV